MNANPFLQKDYENEPPSGPEKTNPKQTQNKPNLERIEFTLSVIEGNGPILSAVGGLQKMNLKSLAKKSGHISTNQKKFWTIPKRTITIISSYRLSISDL